MKHHGSRVTCVVLVVMAVSILRPAAQTVKQGETPAASDKTIFTSPMILETVFAAADRSLWDPTKGHPMGAWFSAPEYEGLVEYSCDGVHLRHFDHKQKTWQSGLAMSVMPGEGGMLNVAVRAMIDNPKKNHDRKIEVLFEVMNGDKVVASTTVKRGVEEGDEKPLLTHFTLAPADLIQEPMTRLRLTIRDAPD